MSEPVNSASAIRRRAREGDAGTKYGRVADRLRREIVRGVWAPGQKLPTWDVLCAQFSVGRPTLTRALAMLKSEGFIEADSTRGTHVTASPPHLSRHVLLFSSAPGRHGAAGWNLFWNSLAMEAMASRATGGAVVDVLFDVNTHADCAACAQVMEDARHHRLAGILVVLGGDLRNLRPAGGIPCIHIGGGPAEESPHHVGLDWQSFHAQAVEALLARGCRKIAVLANDMESAEACARVVAGKGGVVRPSWALFMPGTVPDGARNLTRLLVSRTQRERPDGLIITDDNLVSVALAGVLDERIVVPDDLRVVAHCNWPGTPPPPLPVMRLGFSAAAVLDAALAMASALRASSSPRTHIAVQPVFENDSIPRPQAASGPAAGQRNAVPTRARSSCGGSRPLQRPNRHHHHRKGSA